MRKTVCTLLLSMLTMAAAWAGHFVVTPLPNQQQLPVTELKRIMQDAEGYMWYATHGAGLVRDNGFQQEFFRSDRNNPKLLSRNDLLCMAEDTVTQEIWFGTTVGAYVLSKKDYTVRLLHPQLESLRVFDIVQSRDGSLWVAAGYSVFQFTAHGELVKQYKLDWHGKAVHVSTLFIDSNDRLWAMQWDGGLQSIDTKTGQVTMHEWNLTTCPQRMEEDPAHRGYWIGTYTQGVVFYDGRQTTTVIPPKSNMPAGVHGLLVDRWRGLLWVAFTKCVEAYPLEGPFDKSVFSLDGEFRKFSADSKGNIWLPSVKSQSVILTYEEDIQVLPHGVPDVQVPCSKADLHNETVSVVCAAADSMVYIGTDGSLFAYNQRRHTCRCIESGLGYVRDIAESPEHRLYMVCVKKGVCQLTADDSLRIIAPYKKYRALACDQEERLWIGDEYGDVWQWMPGADSLRCLPAVGSREGSFISRLQADRQGHLWVLTDIDLKEYAISSGNVRRMTPQELGLKSFDRMALTDYGICVSGIGGSRGVSHLGQLDKQAPRVRLGVAAYSVNGQRTLLPPETRAITIDADASILELQLTSFNYVRARDARFAYRLPGWMNEWVELSQGENTIRLINLPKGRYRLEVKAIDDYGQWSQPAKVLTIVRRPAWWETWWARILYALVAAGCVGWTAYHYLRRKRLEGEARMLEQLTEMKLRFFTNVSHELRTPLSLVITPLESIIKSLEADVSQAPLHASLKKVKVHADELLELINRLLDFRKMEVGEMKLHLAGGDLIEFLRVSGESFRPLAESKGLELKMAWPEGSLYTDFDHRMMQHVVYNLLSNAIKYTDKGQVVVECRVEGAEQATALVFAVSDTGIGIPEAELPHIFDRYYQASTATDSTASGTGIGLHMVNAMVSMMGGTITVESQVGKGSTFRLQLPVKVQKDEEQLPSQPIIPKLPTLLIADDNDDFRDFLVHELQGSYNILQARNGREALRLAQQNYIDVVLSDVMMPQMDGNELCRQLKNDEQTSHIFILLLTAKTAEESMLEGYKAGADFYLTKPFSLELLHSRLQYLTKLRQRRIELLSSISNAETEQKETEEDLKLSPIDRRFMEKMQHVMHQHLTDPTFSIDQFAQEMAMSRVSFYRKMNALTGMSPNKYLNEQRLIMADRLLREGELNVSEVADRTGFADPNYFSRSYKARFGITPKDVRGSVS
ncbi:MAG: response regulator [Prevotella sp.]|nr:response regulator [Prevotella sp.]